MTKRIFYTFIHIPKCAGTTFNQILRRNFGQGFYHDFGLINDYQYTGRQVEKIIQSQPWLKCYSTHKISLDLPYNLQDVQIRAITFVRDPVDRFLSDYFFQRNATGNWVPTAKELDIAAYTSWALDEGNQPMYIGGQMLFLTGAPEASKLSLVRDLIQNGKLFLFPVKRFDEACVLLEHQFPQDFTDCSFLRQNITIRDQEVTEADRQRIGKYAQNDYDLLQLANEFLDSQLKANFSELELEAALADLSIRCDLLEINENQKQEAEGDQDLGANQEQATSEDQDLEANQEQDFNGDQAQAHSHKPWWTRIRFWEN